VLEFVTAPQQDATWTEKMFARSLKPYLPYMNENCEFDLTNTRSILPDYDSRFPPMDLGYLTRVIRFCRSKDGERVRRRGEWARGWRDGYPAVGHAVRQIERLRQPTGNSTVG